MAKIEIEDAEAAERWINILHRHSCDDLDKLNRLQYYALVPWWQWRRKRQAREAVLRG